MKIRIKAGVLKQFIRKAIDESWTGEEAMPSVINEPPLEYEPAIIDPKPETQVADTELPVMDDDWQPGNLQMLGMAMKQVAEQVPDGQIQYVWPRLKLLIQKAQENVEGLAHSTDIDAQMGTQMDPQEPMKDAANY